MDEGLEQRIFDEWDAMCARAHKRLTTYKAVNQGLRNGTRQHRGLVTGHGLTQDFVYFF